MLFVCLGNICRSPAAEAELAAQAARRGVTLEVDSAGTSDYHIGETPHDGTRTEAARRGVPIDHRARQVTPTDFADFDVLVAMDASTTRNLRRLAPAGADLDRIVTLDPPVADPWGHPQPAYVAMWDQLERQCADLLDRLDHGVAAGPA